MNYLITGGAGFIGSHIAEHLCSTGANVRVLDNFSTGKQENIAHLNVELVEGDYCDPLCIREALRGIDVVFLQGALCSVTRSVRDPVMTHEVNATGSLTVLEACRNAAVKRLVAASSSSVYGNARSLPKFEGMQESPVSPYAISKLMLEHYCHVYTRTYGLETVALRYFNVFGPRQDPDSDYAAVIPKFIDAMERHERPVIFGDGSQTRDFTYVDNVVRANMLAAQSPKAIGLAFNVGCGESYSLLELLAELQQILGVEIEPRFDDPRVGDVAHSLASIKRARRLMGYEPAVGLTEGLRRTVKWYRGRSDESQRLREAQVAR